MRAFLCLLLVGAAGCASAPSKTTTSPAPAHDSAQADVGRGGISTPNADPFPSTYVAFPSRTTVIRNVNILTAAGPMIRNGAILLQNGKIAAVGATVDAPADALVIDGAGKYVTPGIIDDHSHLGVYAAPGSECAQRRQRGHEPQTPGARPSIRCGLRTRSSPAISPAGVTTLQVLPGSANLTGAERGAQSRPRTHGAGDEVPRREIRTQDGLWRKSQAGLRTARRPSNADGQRRRVSRRLDQSGGVPPQVGQVERRSQGRSTGARPRQRDSRRGAAREHSRPQPLLSRRRDGADDRHRARVRIQDPLVPSRGGGIQNRRPARKGRHRRLDLGGLGQLQDGSARRGEGQHGAGRSRWCEGDRALRRSVGLAAAEPGSGEGDGSRRRDWTSGERGSGHQVAHHQSRLGAGPRRQDRLPVTY